MENNSDIELTQKIKNGEKDAFRELYERYAPRLYNFAISYLKNDADAEEMVQEVFLKIWDKREMLQENRNIKSFVFKIAVNAIYDIIRKKNIERAFSDYIRLNFDQNDNSAWHTLIFEEMQQKLEELIQQLPEQQKRIFCLNKFEGISSVEIAEKMNLSKRTVENHLYRAISFLKNHFKNESFIAALFFYLFCQ